MSVLPLGSNSTWGLVMLSVSVGISFPHPSVQSIRFLDGDPRLFSVTEVKSSKVDKGGWNRHVGKGDS